MYKKMALGDEEYIHNKLVSNYFARIAVYMIGGVCIGYYLSLSVEYYWLAASVVLILLLALYLGMKAVRSFFMTHMSFNILVALLCGMFGAMLARCEVDGLEYEWKADMAMYRAVVEDEVKRGERSRLYDVNVISEMAGESEITVDRKVRLVFSKGEEDMPNIGDEILFKTHIAEPSRDVLSVFDYERYLHSKGISATGFVNGGDYEVCGESEVNNLVIMANKVRAYLALLIVQEKNIEEENIGVIMSILLGDKRELGREVSEEFSAAGASHILAVSGMHVGIFYVVFVLLFSRRLYKRKSKLAYLLCFLLIIMVWAYAFVTGLSPSVERASLMFSVYLIDRCVFNSRFDGKVIALSGILMMIANPLVVFDVGFQLSFAAIISIVVFMPYFMGMVKLKGVMQMRVYQLFAVSFAAQLGVFPLVLLYFYQFPVYFMFSSILVTLLAPLMIYGGVLFLIFAKVGELGGIFGGMLDLCVDFFRHSVEYVAQMPMSTVHCAVEWWQVVVMYIMLIVGLFLVRDFSYRRFVRVALMWFVLLVIVVAPMFEENNNEVLMVAKGRVLAVNVIEDDRNVVYAEDSVESEERFGVYWMEENVRAARFVTSEGLAENCFVYEGKEYLVLRKGALKGKYNVGDWPLVVDVVIVDGGVYPSEMVFERVVRPREKIILTQGVWRGYEAKYETLAEKIGIECYCVRKKGSYIDPI